MEEDRVTWLIVLTLALITLRLEITNRRISQLESALGTAANVPTGLAAPGPTAPPDAASDGGDNR